jgi:hypothetical protein
MGLVKAAERAGRNGLRDGTLILMAYVHGFRASESAISNGTRLTSPDETP